MTSQYDDYTKECAHWAAQAKTEDDRLAFLEIANAWTQAALAKTDVARQSASEAMAWQVFNSALTRRGGRGGYPT